MMRIYLLMNNNNNNRKSSNYHHHHHSIFYCVYCTFEFILFHWGYCLESAKSPITYKHTHINREHNHQKWKERKKTKQPNIRVALRSLINLVIVWHGQFQLDACKSVFRSKCLCVCFVIFISINHLNILNEEANRKSGKNNNNTFCMLFENDPAAMLKCNFEHGNDNPNRCLLDKKETNKNQTHTHTF